MKGANLERQCVSCRKLDRKENMIRFVRLDGRAVMDAAKKIQARGAYVCRNEECLRRLRDKHLLRKALHTAFDEEALAEAEALLTEDRKEAPNG